MSEEEGWVGDFYDSRALFNSKHVVFPSDFTEFILQSSQSTDGSAESEYWLENCFLAAITLQTEIFIKKSFLDLD